MKTTTNNNGNSKCSKVMFYQIIIIDKHVLISDEYLLFSGGLNENSSNPVIKLTPSNDIKTCPEIKSPESPLKIGSVVFQSMKATFAFMCGEKSPKKAGLCYELNYEVISLLILN